jgi:hypothetical protein
MSANVGGLDRTLRIIVGLLLVDIALAGIGAHWAWIGLWPLLTGAAAWCPLYLPRRISTATGAPPQASTEELREAVGLQAHRTVRPRTPPDRNASSD